MELSIRWFVRRRCGGSSHLYGELSIQMTATARRSLWSAGYEIRVRTTKNFKVHTQTPLRTIVHTIDWGVDAVQVRLAVVCMGPLPAASDLYGTEPLLAVICMGRNPCWQ